MRGRFLGAGAVIARRSSCTGSVSRGSVDSAGPRRFPGGLRALCRTVRQTPELAEETTASEPGGRDVTTRVASLRKLMCTS